jgi:hypothetical protein
MFQSRIFGLFLSYSLPLMWQETKPEMQKNTNNNYPSYVCLGALYEHLILHMLPASVHRTVVNTSEGTTNLNPPPVLARRLNLEHQRHWRFCIGKVVQSV